MRVGSYIHYTYDTAGTLLRKGYYVGEEEDSTVIDYSGNCIYENGTLKTILVEGGYITFDSSSQPVYHFYLKDHLGNNRVVANASGEVEHEADHAWDDFNNHKEHLERAATPDSQYSNAEERRVIEGSERMTAKKNGESVRKNHKGALYGVISSTSIVPLNIK